MNAFLLNVSTGTFDEALSLLGIGMISIFLILGLVVLSGNALIIFSNKFLATVEDQLPPVEESPVTSMSPATMAAIVTAVELSTLGKGQIQKILKNPST
ncbi:MAG: hypothetical protein AAFR87_00015 [Bacteroidota bacterium]